MLSPSDKPTGILSDYLTKKELAAELHKTVRTLDRMNLAGDGPPPTRIGRTTLYRRDAVLDWLRNREARTPVRGRTEHRSQR